MSEKKSISGSGKAFATNLKQLRKARGLTQVELGKAIGVQKSCISNYEQNFSMPDISRLLDIAAFFEISDLGQLVGYAPQNTLAEGNGSNRRVPVIHKIQYGTFPFAPDNIIDEFVLPSINLKTGDFMGFIIPDNSMERSKLKKGDIAVVRRQPIISTGDIALISAENYPPLLRKVYFSEKDIITLVPDSDDSSFAPITLDPKKDNFEIMGRLLYVQVTF